MHDLQKTSDNGDQRVKILRNLAGAKMPANPPSFSVTLAPEVNLTSLLATDISCKKLVEVKAKILEQSLNVVLYNL